MNKIKDDNQFIRVVWGEKGYGFSPCCICGEKQVTNFWAHETCWNLRKGAGNGLHDYLVSILKEHFKSYPVHGYSWHTPPPHTELQLDTDKIDSHLVRSMRYEHN
jgi:hypothetical protein